MQRRPVSLAVNVTGASPSNTYFDITYKNGAQTYTPRVFVSGSNVMASFSLTPPPAATTTYQLISVLDANGCEALIGPTHADTFETVTVTTGITSTISKTDATCHGTATGSLTVTPTSGVAPYSYRLSTSSTVSSSNTFTGIRGSSRKYKVCITDANGCTGSSAAIYVNDPPAITATVSPTDVTGCRGGSNGSITITPTSGAAPYMYKLGGGTYSSSNTFGSLSAATYTVYVKDAGGCEKPFIVTIGEPLAISATATTTPASCIGANNGSMTVSGTHGPAPYTYRLGSKRNPYTSNNTFTGLKGKPYQVSIKDASGCTGAVTITIGEQQVSCNRQVLIAKAVNPIDAANAAFDVVLSPNPAQDRFTLLAHSGSNLPIELKVLDVNGKVIYQAKGMPGQPFRFGESFVHGVYMIQVRQGDEVKTVKGMKL